MFLLRNDGFDNNGKLILIGPIKNPYGLGRLNFSSPNITNLIMDRLDGDQDGDQDLFMSIDYGRVVNVAYFENTGTDVSPAFGDLSPMPYHLNAGGARPYMLRFADLEGDGDIDAIDPIYGVIQLNNQTNTRDDQIAHISVRAFSEAGEGRIIGGFEVLGPSPQKVIVKGIGPSLAAAGIEQPLPDPVLTLFKGQQPIYTNDDWQNGSRTVEGTAFAPDNANEAVLDLELEPGVYTVHLTDKQGLPGVGIVSIDTPQYSYLGSPRPKQRSFRVQVGNGEDVAIVGFVVQDGPKQVLIRGVGPSLSANGVNNVLADPELLLFSGSKQIASNQDWQELPNAEALRQAGEVPGDSREAIILQYLEPGTYTVHLRGRQGGQGVGIIGISTFNE